MLPNKPKKLTIYNLNDFFEFKSVAVITIRPGMFLQFRYSSPEGVHDVKPLVFILERKADRIWGLNFHYQFDLMAPLLQLKDAEVQKFLQNNSDWKKYQRELTKPTPDETTDKGIPDVDELEKDMVDKSEKIVKEEPVKPFDVKKVRFPPLMLENFANNKIKPPKEILRNYLYNRMNGIQKLVYKVV